MANLYGVANSPGYVAQGNLIGGSNIVCNASVYTPIIQIPAFQAPSNGWFYPLAWVDLSITIGATAPSSISFALSIGAGAVGAPSGPSNATLPISSTLYIPATLVGAMSQVAWQGAGSTVTVQCNPSGQSVTVLVAGSWATVAYFRAPDQ